MNGSILQLVTWAVVGGLAGTVAAMFLTRKRKGYGLLTNVVVGMIGAVVGGYLFGLLGISIGANISISLNDLIAAFAGSVVLIVVVRFLRRRL